MTLLYATFVLRDVSQITKEVKEVTQKVNQFVLSPIRAAEYVIEHVKPYLMQLQEKVEQRTAKKRRKKDDEED